MEERGRFEEFSLLGGPLHRLGRRVGLVRGGTNTVALGLALGLVLWTVLVALAFFEGVSQQLFSLSVIGGHVRLLVVIPLFFICESVLEKTMKKTFTILHTNDMHSAFIGMGPASDYTPFTLNDDATRAGPRAWPA
jgi:hypothetical protein